MKRSLFAVGMLVFVSSMVVLAQTSAPASGKDPRVGVWKMNLEKSKVANPPKMNLRQWSTREDGLTVFTMSAIDAQGNPGFSQTAFKLDGKDYPTYNDNTLLPFAAGAKAGTTSVKIVDAYTTITTPKDAKGLAGLPTTGTVSKDGKTLTMTTKGRNAQGQEVNSVSVFDKQ
jgi:hypothetical protein